MTFDEWLSGDRYLPRYFEHKDGGDRIEVDPPGGDNYDTWLRDVSPEGLVWWFTQTSRTVERAQEEVKSLIKDPTYQHHVYAKELAAALVHRRLVDD